MPLGRLPFLGRKQDDSSFQQRERFVRVVYKGLLHREPEDEALKYWVEALARRTHAEILECFLNCEEFARTSKEKLFVPPGHFYSPIVNVAEAEAHLRRVEAQATPEGIPGINIDRDQMVRTWHKLLPFMRSAPFADNPGSGCATDL